MAVPSLPLSSLGCADQDIPLALLPLTCSCIHSLSSPIPYEELVRLIDEASEKNLSVSILTQVRGQDHKEFHSWVSALVSSNW